jgi:hypothetical protein
MSAFNSNNPYLAIDGIVVDTEWKEVEITGTMETQVVTQGVGRTGTQRAEGLRDASIRIVAGYRTEKIQQQLAIFKPGRHTVTYGPEGNVAGKPKHVQEFIFNDLPLTQTVSKDEVTLTSGGEQADEPLTDMYSGGVW